MELVPIYRFEVFDQQQGGWVTHPLYATDAVIQRLGGRPLPETHALVHPCRIDAEGFVPLVP